MSRLSRWIVGARGDQVCAVRSLARSPGFTIAATLRLAVGIGATTATSSVVDVLGRTIQGLCLAALGVAVGFVGAAAATRSLQAMLFGITPLDAWTFAAVAAAFSLVAAAASYLPARRAADVEPVVALHCD